MMNTLPALRTTRIMVRELGISAGQFRELFRQNPEIHPAARAGRARLCPAQARGDPARARRRHRSPRTDFLAPWACCGRLADLVGQTRNGDRLCEGCSDFIQRLTTGRHP